MLCIEFQLVFLSMCLWAVYSLYSLIFSFTSSKEFSENETVKNDIEPTTQFTKKTKISLGGDYYYQRLNFLKASAIIYAISFFILLAIYQGWINVQKEVSLCIPLPLTTIYVLYPFIFKVIEPILLK